MNKKRDQKEDGDIDQGELRKLLGLENDPEYAGNYSSDDMSKIMDEMQNDELQQEWDDFDDLMMFVPKYLQYLKEHLVETSGTDLFPYDFKKDVDEAYKNTESFSDNAIQTVEKSLTEASVNQNYSQSNIDELMLAVALYIGEAAVVRLEGEWLIWDKQGDIDYGKPVVAFWVNDDYGLKLNPFETIALLIESKIENALSGSLKAIEQALKRG